MGRAWVAVGVVGLLAGCGGDDEALPDASAPYTLEVQLGTSSLPELQWEPLLDDSIKVRMRSMGGIPSRDLFVHARGRDFDPGDPAVPGAPENPETAFVASADGELVSIEVPPYRLGYVQADDGWLELAGPHLLPMEPSLFPGIYGVPVQLELRVIDAGGLRGREVRTITIERECEPLLQDCTADPAAACYLIEADAVCLLPPAEPLAPGAPCQFTNECAPGHGCVGSFFSGTCRVYCDFARYPNERDPDRCEPNETCEAIDGIAHVGQCLGAVTDGNSASLGASE